MAWRLWGSGDQSHSSSKNLGTKSASLPLGTIIEVVNLLRKVEALRRTGGDVVLTENVAELVAKREKTGGRGSRAVAGRAVVRRLAMAVTGGLRLGSVGHVL